MNTPPEEIRAGDVLYTHISPRRRKAKILDVYEAWNVFGETDARKVFIGYAHIPLLFGEWSGHACSATEYPLASNVPLALDSNDRYIVCVGAVGYSRDGIAKPRHAIYGGESGTVESRAVDAEVLPLGSGSPATASDSEGPEGKGQEQGARQAAPLRQSHPIPQSYPIPQHWGLGGFQDDGGGSVRSRRRLHVCREAEAHQHTLLLCLSRYS